MPYRTTFEESGQPDASPERCWTASARLPSESYIWRALCFLLTDREEGCGDRYQQPGYLYFDQHPAGWAVRHLFSPAWRADLGPHRPPHAVLAWLDRNRDLDVFGRPLAAALAAPADFWHSRGMLALASQTARPHEYLALRGGAPARALGLLPYPASSPGSPPCWPQACASP